LQLYRRSRLHQLKTAILEANFKSFPLRIKHGCGIKLLKFRTKGFVRFNRGGQLRAKERCGNGRKFVKFLFLRGIRGIDEFPYEIAFAVDKAKLVDETIEAPRPRPALIPVVFKQLPSDGPHDSAHELLRVQNGDVKTR